MVLITLTLLSQYFLVGVYYAPRSRLDEDTTAEFDTVESDTPDAEFFPVLGLIEVRRRVRIEEDQGPFERVIVVEISKRRRGSVPDAGDSEGIKRWRIRR